MAQCTQYTSFTVTGAGTSSANGSYIPAGVATPGRGNTIFTKDGTLSYPRITVDGSGQGQWAILGNTPFPGAPFYSAPADSYGSNDCPAGLNWSETTFGVSPAPTVTGTPAAPSQPTFGLPAETVALIVSNFGSVANYLRLRNQGQV
jgi:hypothetical protein